MKTTIACLLALLSAGLGRGAGVDPVPPRPEEVERDAAELALQHNQVDQALLHAEKAVALAPDNADCQHTLGDAYGLSAQRASLFRQFGLAKKCVAAYERACALAPDNVDFHLSLFEYYRQAPSMVGGGPEKARAEAETIRKLSPSRGHLVFGALDFADKKYDLALAEYEAVLKSTPDDYAALFQIGRLAAMTGQYLDRGLASLQRCLKLPPPDPNTVPGHAAVEWRIGNILEKEGDRAGARAAYEAAVKIDPTLKQAADALKRVQSE